MDLSSSFCMHRRTYRMVSLTVICTAIFGAAPQYLIGAENDAIFQAEMGNPAPMIYDFDDLEMSKKETEALIVEIRSFLKGFIDEINARYMTQISLQQVCRIVKENLDRMELSPELHADLFEAIDLLGESDAPSALLSNAVSLPWKWSLPSLAKNNKHTAPVLNRSRVKKSAVVGAAEAIVGCQLMTCSGSTYIGDVLLSDGIRRAAKGKKTEGVDITSNI